MIHDFAQHLTKLRTCSSEERAPFFLWAYARGIDYPAQTERGGKFLLFVNRDDVDEVWPKIREALDTGRLGECAKVSTARPNPNSSDPKRQVICVYTYDSEDAKDRRRVLASLRKLDSREGFPTRPTTTAEQVATRFAEIATFPSISNDS
jgi:hypothetical protein